MQLPLEVHFHNMDHSDALEERAREAAQKLEQACPPLQSCRVYIEAAHRTEGAGDLYEVRIDMRVPGHELAVHHTQNEADKKVEDAHQALTRTFKVAEKRLRAYLDKQKDLKKGRGAKPGRAEADAIRDE
ncbi:HPF/RaiA family ribosome-associated protein [Natronospira bacteriovora]|uniref:HPF/RaiA family ribosome-associated protein n=1 Tax=Natronospira bacteriovora TaxID=3069753 RepID=A0ABU0W6J9_9GAMM|nr:HPF/RaiA family ribosome-associated protein [Natronospira sp. AB-CW4]MDQ2069085.1 HPF/RaiA family ribosome-associated protein [Natronospira sp. AB-CW4]